MTHILRTRRERKTASLTDEGNSAYCQSSGAHIFSKGHSLPRMPLFLRGPFLMILQPGLSDKKSSFSKVEAVQKLKILNSIVF